MKRIRVVGILVLLILLLMGCNNNNNTKYDEKDIAGENVDNNVDKTDDEPTEVKNELTGKGLLDSLDLNYVEKNLAYKVKATNGEEQEDIITEVYLFYGNIKEVYDTIDGKNVMIYIANDKATYQYVEGEKKGTVFYNVGDDANQETISRMGDIESLFYSGELIEAKKVEYNNEIVLYVETLEDTLTNKIWFSTEYGMPLKTQINDGDVILYESEIFDIKRLGAGDDIIFNPPNDIEFINFEENSIEEEVE